MNASPDPELAVTVPGNEQARWKKTEKQLRKLEKNIKKAMPNERRAKLMFAQNCR